LRSSGRKFPNSAIGLHLFVGFSGWHGQTLFVRAISRVGGGIVLREIKNVYGMSGILVGNAQALPGLLDRR